MVGGGGERDWGLVVRSLIFFDNYIILSSLSKNGGWDQYLEVWILTRSLKVSTVEDFLFIKKKKKKIS